jgi:hypothetical protein
MRFVPSAPWHAALQVLDEVTLETALDNDIWVISDNPAQPGDILTLEVAAGAIRRTVRVVDCETAIVDSALRYRVGLSFLTPERSLIDGGAAMFEMEREYGI